MDFLASLIPLAFVLAALGLVVGAIYGSLRMARGCEGGWRKAALLPLVALGLAAANIVVGTAIDPTSHNLWPFEIVMVSAVGVAWLGLLGLVRAAAAPSPAAHTTSAPPPAADVGARRSLAAPADSASGLHALLAHPAARLAAGGLGLYAILYGYGALRVGEGRGAAALMVFGAGGLFLAATGRAPTWLFRR